MTKSPHSMPEKKQRSRLLPGSNSPSDASRRIPLWQALVLPLAAIFVFFLLLEGGLALFGVKQALQTEDPFVGFAANAPLFVPVTGPKGEQFLTTATNKKDYFNRQSFPQEKGPGTYRIFCLGGSTTYGRPYDDATSFAGWLRELLPAADRSRKWEVINAGGISYASYRVAHLMEELVHYQPDLFIIYTGHNEFLEERTYRKLRDIPPLVRSAASLLARTRTWSAMKVALQSFLGIHPETAQGKRNRLAVEVDAILDKSAGLDRYTRDDPFKKNILQHYRLSSGRMVEMARSVGAQVIFVTPGSNLKDCSPFKSEHTVGLDFMGQQRVEEMLAKAKEEIQHKRWQEALNLLATATALDPRHAGLQYHRGKVLLNLGRFDEAEIALRLARDEDVCPLRALTPMHQIVFEVAKEQKVGIVDYVDLLEQHMQQTKGHNIPGEEFFLDHVHPTIEGHKILAVALINEMIEKSLVQPETNWDEQAIASVEAKIRDSIDEGAHGFALANLARVFLWAKKIEDADRLAQNALEIAGNNKQVVSNASTILSVIALHQGKHERAVQLLYSAVEKMPDAAELRLKLGEILLNPPFQELEKAAANVLLATRQMPNYDRIHDLFGIIMAKRGRPMIAYPSLMQALRLNPNNTRARKALEDIRPLLKGQTPNPWPAEIVLDTYPSSAPRKLAQVRPDTSGNRVADGIEVEFHENGRLKRFLDISKEKSNGIEIGWDKAGRLLK